jgi:hypothetical protein
MALYHALQFPGAFVVIVAPTLRQASELLLKIRRHVVRLGIRAKRDGAVQSSILLPNGSRLVALPGTEATNRCYGGVTLMIIDEASRVPDEVYDAVRPFLATTNGKLWLISTPNGKQGFFWREWEKGAPQWQRFLVVARDCPRISAEFLAEERAQGDRRFRQEYECEFLERAGGVFDVSLLKVSTDFKPLRV